MTADRSHLLLMDFVSTVGQLGHANNEEQGRRAMLEIVYFVIRNETALRNQLEVASDRR